MAISLKPLHEQVIVITGASSGIGLTTALAAAKKGARLVLTSRNKEALEEAERKIKEEKGEAIYVVADVGSREELEKVADAAIARYGGIDTWVNNAGVAIFGRLEEVSDEDSRRLFDTNFWGVVNGSLIAARHLKTGGGGAIINLGSVLSDVSLPIQGMYSASKHAVKGFTDALRLELEQEKAKISVTLIKPSSINTPYPEHARNYTDRELTLPPPVYEPEEVASAILYSATHQQRDLFVGSGGKIMSNFNWRSPKMMDWVSENLLAKRELRDTPATHHEGSLHQHGEDGHTHGNYKGYVMKNSLYTRSAMHPVLTGTLMAAAGVGILALIGSNSLKQQEQEERQTKQ